MKYYTKRGTAGKFDTKLYHRLNTRLHDCRYSGKLRVVPRPQHLLLGCTYDEWAKHLGLTESDELTADRTIDHIIPVKCYDLNNEEDLYRCFNYKNTQLLHTDENNKKGTKLPDLETLLTLSAIWPVGIRFKAVE